ncbi:P-loop containing nucleoside triphosphate hydrolase protein, partial [Obba rivulosa]
RHSPVERKIVDHKLSCYVLGRSGTGKTTTMLAKIFAMERTWIACGKATAKPRQLFITKSAVLANKVEQYYTRLARTILLSGSSEDLDQIPEYMGERISSSLLDRDEEGRQDLPRSFGDLTDEHFPLFTTVDQVCMRPLFGSSHHNINPVCCSCTTCWSSISMRWVPRGNLHQTKVRVNVSRVIKGSEPTLHLPGNILDRQSYLQYSGRSQATFADRRPHIYDLFESYIKLKRERRERDAADSHGRKLRLHRRTHRIIHGFQECNLSRIAVDFLYVDEAQDNLLIDAFVLRSLCRNPNGLFWAGDTAQTISLGSSFNFNELKAFNWRIERRKIAPHKNDFPPETFQLAVNYRSHAGIVDCARSVIDLITKFWPDSIDHLAREQAMVLGPKPVFYNDSECEDPRCLEQFFSAQNNVGATFTNGRLYAHMPCAGILVRDVITLQRLRSLLGEVPHIFTILDSKGLEFNDVLLYNFFADSAVEYSVWRIISRLSLNQATYTEVDVALCRELKSLYVSLTRARSRIWIVDCSVKAIPMRNFWAENDQIVYRHLNVSTDRHSSKKSVQRSSREEWAKSARKLFDSHLYADAARCFKQAHMPAEESVACAYLARQQASSHSTTTGEKNRARAFEDAAKAFSTSATHFEDSEDGLKYLRIAAECLTDAGQYLKAAETYLEAQQYQRAAQQFRKCGRFDRCIETIQSHRSSIDDDVASSLVHVARLHYLTKVQLSKASKLFASDDEILQFMEEHGLDAARAVACERMGKLLEAAELQLSEGHKVKAIQLFLKHGSADAFARAEDCLLEELWLHFSYAIPVRPHADVDQLLQLAEELVRSSDSISRHFRTQVRGSSRHNLEPYLTVVAYLSLRSSPPPSPKI